MTINDILDNAIYIQFPYNNEYYADWYVNKYNLKKHVTFMPIILNQRNIQYDNMPGNAHHYTTYYHRTYVLPILSSLLNFNFSLNDFNKIEQTDTNNEDISYLIPKQKTSYTVQSFTRGFTKEYSYLELMPIYENPNSCYRFFYKFFHECSRIINNNLHNGRKLLISGDSQMIPSILALTQYFEEVWYMDNRTGHVFNKETKQFEKTIDMEKLQSFSKFYKDVEFTDVLIELYTNPLNWYTEINLY